jgi:hypothetical protein
MSYLDRLKNSGATGFCIVPKGTKGTSGTSGTQQDGALPNISSDATLQAFIQLVRATAACDHQTMLHPDEIAAELDAVAAADLASATRETRQSWAAAIAQRLAGSLSEACTNWRTES